MNSDPYDSPKATQKIAYITLDIILILLGIGIMLGGDEGLLADVGPALVMTMVGVLMLSTPSITMTISLLVFGVGLFSLLWAGGIIAFPLFRYTLGIFIIIVSLVNLIKIFKGTIVSWPKTFFR